MGHLATQMIGARMVTADGTIVQWDQEQSPDELRALRCALGTLGILTQVRLRVMPVHDLRRVSWCSHVEHVLAYLDELILHNHLFDFYWYPRSDLAQVRTHNPPGREPELEVPIMWHHEQDQGPVHEVLPKTQQLRYEEMEYLLPAEAGPQCFRQVRDRIKQRHRQYVGWRVLYRTIAGADAYLSPSYGRDTVSIALLQNHHLPWRDYFADIEQIFLAYDGRPHWGKRHNATHDQLRSRYPEWHTFQQLRRALDPHGLFLNDYLRSLLEPKEASR